MESLHYPLRMSPAHRQSLLFCGSWSRCSCAGLRPCGGVNRHRRAMTLSRETARRGTTNRWRIIVAKEDTRSVSESENPAIPSPTPKRRQPRTNKDWWPNQLDLSVLHHQSHLSNPMDEDFNY